MEFILTFITWSILIVSLFFMPVIIIWFLFKKSSKPKSYLYSSAIILITLCLVVLSTLRPMIIVPKEYKRHIHSEDKVQIRSYNDGIYSKYIPFFPLYIIIDYADEDTIKLTNHYYPLGKTKMTIENGEPNLGQAIFQQIKKQSINSAFAIY